MTASVAKRVRVRSTRYDGSLRDVFDAELLQAEDGVIRVRIYAGTIVTTATSDTPEIATATQIFFTDRWFNVNHFHEIVAPYSNLWYANLSMPAEFDGAEVRWVDFDRDNQISPSISTSCATRLWASS